MGLQEGMRADGWYNGYITTQIYAVGFDGKRASAIAKEDLQKRLAELAANPAYTVSFFNNKLLSQWTETTYEAFWVNKNVRYTREPPAWKHSILYGDANRGFERWMDASSAALFLAFAAALVRLAFKRGKIKWDDCFGIVTLVVAVFGGWLFHMIFEAKSQYMVVYLPMIIPAVASLCVKTAPWQTDGELPPSA